MDLISKIINYEFIENEIYEFVYEDDILYVIFVGLSRIDGNYLFRLNKYKSDILYKYTHIESGISFTNYRRQLRLFNWETTEEIDAYHESELNSYKIKIREYHIDSIINSPL